MTELHAHSSDPLYLQIKDALRLQIESGKFKREEAIPDERTLAEDLKVSRKTVRRAISELADEGLLRRIRGRGTFVRGSFSPQPTHRRNCVAVACTYDPYEENCPYYEKILQGIYRGLYEQRCHWTYVQISAPYDRFIANLKQLGSLKGIIAVGVEREELLDQLNRLSIPVVLVESVQSPDQPRFDLVSHDGAPGIYEATCALIQQGHTDIGFLRAEHTNVITSQRYEGFKRAMIEARLPLRPEREYSCSFYAQAAHASVTRILASGSPPTALVCTGDELAQGAMAAVMDFGWRVPRDLSVVGFGDYGFYTSPWMSTVSVPRQRMGQMAVKLFMERLKNPTTPPRRELLPVRWEERGSCDAPRKSHVTPLFTMNALPVPHVTAQAVS